MNILSKLTIKNLKLNKKRSAVLVVGILLSMALMTCVAGMAENVYETAKIITKKHNGDFHYSTDRAEIFPAIEKSSEVENYYYISALGYAKIHTGIEQKPYLKIITANQTAREQSGFRLLEGDWPKQSGEIVITESLSTKLRQQGKIGAELDLALGSIDPSSTNLTQRKFKIVGIIFQPSDFIESYNDPSFTALTINEDHSVWRKIFYRLKHPSENHLQKIATGINSKQLEEIKSSLVVNHHLLKLEGNFLSNDLFSTLAYLASIIIAVIAATSILVIKNGFSISVTEKIRQYGILKSLGATNRQISGAVLREGLWLGTFGIILGAGLGIGVNYLLVFIVNILLGEFESSDGKILYAKFSLLAVLISAVVTYLTIILSSLMITQRLKRLSAISAIKSTEDIKLKAKKLSTPKWIHKIFGVGGVIASKNLKRNRKKYRTTVVSLTLSITVFMAMSFFVQSIMKTIDIQLLKTNFNILIAEPNISSHDFAENSKILEKTRQEILSDTPHSLAKDVEAKMEQKYFSEQYLNHYLEWYRVNPNNSEPLSLQIRLLDRESFTKLFSANNLNQNSRCLVPKFTISNNHKKKTLIETFKPGDIELILDKDHRLSCTTQTIEKAPIGSMDYPYMGSQAVFMEVDDFLAKFPETKINYLTLSVQAKDDRAMTERIRRYFSEQNARNLFVSSLTQQMRIFNNLILLVQIFGYGFILVITLIGLTNVFNTINTNVLLRKREFATLRSIGMTDREFNRMVALESLFYGTKALLFGLSLGTILTWLIHQAINKSLEMPYQPPWIAALICVIFIFTIVHIIMRYSVKNTSRQNIIETIRNENI